MRTSLKRQALIVFSIVQLLGAVTLLSSSLLILYIFGLFALIGILLIDYLLLPTSELLAIVASNSKNIEIDQEFSFNVQVSLINPGILGFGNVSLRKFHHPFIQPISIEQDKIANNDNTTLFQFQITARAIRVGTAKIENLQVDITSKYKLLSRTFKLDVADCQFIITPLRAKIPDAVFQTLTKNQRILNQGVSSIKKSRVAEQFHSIRDYKYPDPIKYIDHKKSAKFGSLMTKTFESLHSHHLIICLDMGRPMFGKVGNSLKLDYYLSACMHLSQFAQKQGDQVSFLAFSQKAHLVKLRAKKQQDMWRAISDPKLSHPYEEESNYQLISKALPLHALSRSIVVILTDVSHPYVQSSLMSTVKALSKKHLVLSLSLIQDDYEIRSKILKYEGEDLTEESATDFLYSYWLSDQIESFSKKLDYVGSGAVVVPAEYWLSSTERIYSKLRESNRL